MIQTDSKSLRRTLSTFENKNTGLGTTRDKSITADIGYSPRLYKHEIDQLFSNSKIIRRLVEYYPKACQKAWVEMKVTNGEADLNLLTEYFKGFKHKKGRKSLRQAFKTASILARKHGDAFILLGVADGLNPEEPIDYNRIQSIEWLKILECDDVTPDRSSTSLKSYEDPEHYFVWNSDQDIQNKWHWSRVLHFKGAEKYSEYEDYRNDSVIQGFYESFRAWMTGNMSSSAMLADYSQGVHKMKGLGQGLEDDIRNGTNTFQQQVLQRLLTIEMSRSITKAPIIDMDEEDG